LKILISRSINEQRATVQFCKFFYLTVRTYLVQSRRLSIFFFKTFTKLSLQIVEIVTTFNRPISYKLIKKTILVYQIHKMLCLTVKNMGFNILLLLLVCCYEAILWSSMKQYWIFPKITSLFQIYQSNVKRFSYNCYAGLLNKIKVMLDLSIRYDSVSMAELFVIKIRN